MNRSFRRSCLACFFLLSAVSAQSAVADLVTDDFNSYTVGSGLSGQNGGTGFTGAWSGANTTITTNGFAGSNAATGAGSSTTFRTLPSSVTSIFSSGSGSIWASFDFSSITSNQQFAGLNFYQGGTERILIGKNSWGGPEDDSNWRLASNSGLGVVSDVSFTTIKTGVVRFNLASGSGGSADLWIGSTVGPVDTTGTPTLSLAGLTLGGIDRIYLRGSTTFTVDNFKMSSSPFAVPEPSSLALFGLGAIALIRRRRPKQ